METSLKLRYGMDNGKSKTFSIANAKQDAADSDIKALGMYMLNNSIVEVDGAKLSALKSATMITQTKRIVDIA